MQNNLFLESRRQSNSKNCNTGCVKVGHWYGGERSDDTEIITSKIKRETKKSEFSVKQLIILYYHTEIITIT